MQCNGPCSQAHRCQARTVQQWLATSWQAPLAWLCGRRPAVLLPSEALHQAAVQPLALALKKQGFEVNGRGVVVVRVSACTQVVAKASKRTSTELSPWKLAAAAYGLSVRDGGNLPSAPSPITWQQGVVGQRRVPPHSAHRLCLFIILFKLLCLHFWPDAGREHGQRGSKKLQRAQ